jgi:hypothetical protein
MLELESLLQQADFQDIAAWLHKLQAVNGSDRSFLQTLSGVELWGGSGSILDIILDENDPYSAAQVRKNSVLSAVGTMLIEDGHDTGWVKSGMAVLEHLRRRVQER